MKLHTNTLRANDVRQALHESQWAYPYNVAEDVEFVVFGQVGSRTRSHGFELQLGTYDKNSGPTKSRRFKNSGQHGADTIYAATYDEWGFFIARIFAADPDAVFGPYKGRADFEAQTKFAYPCTTDGRPLFETV